MRACSRAIAESDAPLLIWQVWGYCWLAAALLLIAGCQSSSGSQRKTDTTLQRHVKHGGQAYAEGQLELAIVEYRKALRRAWAMDNPHESGTAAYNLAACLTSDSRSAEAKDWLLDSRVELSRAGESAGNVWILEAKIAQNESRFEDVHYLTQRAACAEPPCPDTSCHGCCGGDDPCDDSCVAKIPCIGPKIKKRQAAEECRDSYQAQIHLVQARAAAEQYDIRVAKQQLACACKLAEGVCSYDLHAELHNVAALIHIAKGEFLQAGRHLDLEALNLRLAGNYREIPTALELASAAYDQVGLPEIAADRLCRVARILFGRGELDRAWSYVQLAGPLAESACAETTKVRLGLLANEILLTLTEQGDPLPTRKVDEDVGMLAPANAAMSLHTVGGGTGRQASADPPRSGSIRSTHPANIMRAR